MRNVASFVSRMILGISLAISGFAGGCKGLYQIPPTYPPGTTASPNAQPLPQTRPTDPAFAHDASAHDKIEAITTRLNTLALTVAATAPPGPIQTGGLFSAGVMGAIISLNELLKKLRGGNPPTNPAP